MASTWLSGLHFCLGIPCELPVNAPVHSRGQPACLGRRMQESWVESQVPVQPSPAPYGYLRREPADERTQCVTTLVFKYMMNLGSVGERPGRPWSASSSPSPSAHPFLSLLAAACQRWLQHWTPGSPDVTSTPGLSAAEPGARRSGSPASLLCAQPRAGRWGRAGRTCSPAAVGTL